MTWLLKHGFAIGMGLAVTALGFATLFLGLALNNAQNQTVSGEIYDIDSPTLIAEDQVPAFRRSEINLTTFRCLRTDDPVLFKIDLTWREENGEHPPIPEESVIIEQENGAGGAGCEGSTEDPIHTTRFTPAFPPGQWKFLSEITVINADSLEVIEVELNSSEVIEVVE